MRGDHRRRVHRFLEKGYVYRGLKPVYWCIYDRTALAEAEVEYEDHTSPSVWVKFPVCRTPQISESWRAQDVSALIWTTTPWTLPANRALAFHPEFEYVVADTAAGKLLLAKERVNGAGVENWESRLRGTQRRLERARVRRREVSAPVSGLRRCRACWRITSRSIRAAASCTPLRAMARKTSTPGRNTASKPTRRRMTKAASPKACPNTKARPSSRRIRIIVELLKKRGMLVGEQKLAHSYPHCWRCHNPVIFRATEQWFIGLDHDNLRQSALDGNRQSEMEAGMGRGAHSRHGGRAARLVHLAAAVLGRAADHFLLRRVRQAASRISRRCGTCFPSSSAKARTPGTRIPPRNCCRPGTKCACGAAKWRKEEDMLDVWFDSGSTHLSVLTNSPVSNTDGTWRRGRVSGRARPVSRLVPQLVAGCGGHQGARAVSPGGDARLDARRKGRADVEVARQRDVAERNLRRSGARTCCACGWRRRTIPPTCGCPNR